MYVRHSLWSLRCAYKYVFISEQGDVGLDNVVLRWVMAVCTLCPGAKIRVLSPGAWCRVGSRTALFVTHCQILPFIWNCIRPLEWLLFRVCWNSVTYFWIYSKTSSLFYTRCCRVTSDVLASSMSSALSVFSSNHYIMVCNCRLLQSTL